MSLIDRLYVCDCCQRVILDGEAMYERQDDGTTLHYHDAACEPPRFKPTRTELKNTIEALRTENAEARSELESAHRIMAKRANAIIILTDRVKLAESWLQAYDSHIGCALPSRGLSPEECDRRLIVYRESREAFRASLASPEKS